MVESSYSKKNRAPSMSCQRCRRHRNNEVRCRYPTWLAACIVAGLVRRLKDPDNMHPGLCFALSALDWRCWACFEDRNCREYCGPCAPFFYDWQLRWMRTQDCDVCGGVAVVVRRTSPSQYLNRILNISTGRIWYFSKVCVNTGCCRYQRLPRI